MSEKVDLVEIRPGEWVPRDSIAAKRAGLFTSWGGIGRPESDTYVDPKVSTRLGHLRIHSKQQLEREIMRLEIVLSQSHPTTENEIAEQLMSGGAGAMDDDDPTVEDPRRFFGKGLEDE